MNVPMLSTYPADKLVVVSDKCGLGQRFDKAAMLRAGGIGRSAYCLMTSPFANSPRRTTSPGRLRQVRD